MRSSKSRSRSKSNRQRSLGNIVNRVFESSGPEGKVRGTPQQIIEKYLTLARDAQLSNDRVAEQSFLQHAEHYTRMLGEAQREMAERQAQQNQNNNHGHPHHRQNGDDDQNGHQHNRDQRRDEPEPEVKQAEPKQPEAEDAQQSLPIAQEAEGDAAPVETPEAEAKPARSRTPRSRTPRSSGGAPRSRRKPAADDGAPAADTQAGGSE